MMNKKRMYAILLAIAMVLSMAACGSEPAEKPAEDPAESLGTIILATTTSTKDSGLLDYLLPEFTAQTGWDVDVISVGSGEAMAMGEAGEADVLLVHSPAAEKAFVDGGHADAEGRFDVMYNDFVMIGPAEDPAGIKTAAVNDAVTAFTSLADAQEPFISRGDDSGTHKKELALWDKAGITPEGEWYISAGTGMGAVITMANEKLTYTLTDRATWLNVGEDTDLSIVCEKDPSGVLNNQYGVICVNSKKNDKINAEGAKAFQNWILSKETQEIIGKYGIEEYGAPLFTPNAKE